MKPIEFTCSRIIPVRAAGICDQIADTDRWSDFQGYGPLPGIRQARYEKRTETMAGSRIRVRNTDGSEHVEEIMTWVPGREIGIRMHDFSPPLNRLATHFTEDWTFEPRAESTFVTRTIRMYPRGALARPVLWIISLLLSRAIARHLQDMAG